VDADDIQAEGLAEFLVNFAEHLVGLDDFDPITIPAQERLAHAGNGTGPHSGLESRAEINTDAVGFPVVKGGREPFA
jgi:hypothetical protein